MKVLDLRCSLDHLFEGWFASEEAFQDQLGRGLVACPSCGDTSVGRIPSAPRLNVARASEPATGAATNPSVTLQSQWFRAVRHVLASTEDVGERFAEEARRIHYGEVEERGIRGRASREDADALRDEGIEVVSLPVPDALKGPMQ